MILYEYLERRDRGGVQEVVKGVMNLWLDEGLEKRQRIQLEQKLDRLEQVDYDIAKDWIAGTDEAGIFKLRLKGNVQLRPLLCYGPFQPQEELTFLLGVLKKGGGDVPAASLAVAVKRREEIIEVKERRIPYVRSKRETD